MSSFSSPLFSVVWLRSSFQFNEKFERFLKPTKKVPSKSYSGIFFEINNWGSTLKLVFKVQRMDPIIKFAGVIKKESDCVLLSKL